MLHLVNIFLLIISLIIFRRMIDKKAFDIDQGVVTPSDYTLWIKDLPQGTTEDDIKQFIESEQYILENETFQPKIIKKLNFCFDIGKFVDAARKLRQLEADKVYVEDYFNKFEMLPNKKVMCRTVAYNSAEEIQEQIQQTKADFEALLQEFDKRMEEN